MHYELRDHPDDLPVILHTDFRGAMAKAERRANRIGSPVLLYEVDDMRGETLIGEF